MHRKQEPYLSGGTDLIPLMLETEYSDLFDQYMYHASWCPGSLSRQGISRHGIDSMG